MSFLLLTPIVGVAGTALYTYRNGFQLWMPLLALAMYARVGSRPSSAAGRTGPSVVLLTSS